MTQKLVFFVVSAISDSSKQVHQSKPCPENVEYHTQIDDPVDVDRFGKMDRMCKDDPFKIVRTREEVDIQMVRSVVSVGLPMRFCHSYCFDNNFYRSHCFDNVTKVVKWISLKKKTFVRFQFIVKKLIVTCQSSRVSKQGR